MLPACGSHLPFGKRLSGIRRVDARRGLPLGVSCSGGSGPLEMDFGGSRSILLPGKWACYFDPTDRNLLHYTMPREYTTGILLSLPKAGNIATRIVALPIRPFMTARDAARLAQNVPAR